MKMIDAILDQYRKIFRDRVYLSLTVFAPVLSLVLLASIYSNEILRDLPVAILDNDNSALSRKIAFYLDASASLKNEFTLHSIDEVEELIKSGKIEAAIVIPSNLEKDVKKGNKTSITVIKNSFNLVTSNVILKETSTILSTVSAGINIKKFTAKGNSNAKAQALANPVNVISNPMFNTNYSYIKFLVPGITLFFIQMSLMIAGVMSFNTKRFGIFEGTNGYVSRILAHLSFAVIFQTIAFGVIFPLYNLEFTGYLPQLILLFLVFSAASYLPGTAVSLFVPDLQNASEYVMFFNTPAFIFSGLTFPIWAMPLLHRIFSEIIPLTHFLEVFLGIGYMDVAPGFYSAQMLKLFAFILLPLLLIAVKLLIPSEQPTEVVDVK